MQKRSSFFLAVLMSVSLLAGCSGKAPAASPAAASSPAASQSAAPSAAQSSAMSSTKPSSAVSASPSEKAQAVGKVIDAAAGISYSLIVTADGRLLACGDYEKNVLASKELGLKTETLKQLDTGVRSCAAGAGCCAEIKADDSLYIWGSNPTFFKQAQKTPVKILDGVKSVAVGDAFLLALKGDGALWAMGNNTYGQLGTGNTQDAPAPVEVMKDVKEVAAGSDFSLILKNDGTLLGCGSNFSKQFGDVSDKQVPYMEFGKDSGVKFGIQSVPAELKKGVTDIAAGNSHIMVLDTNGDVWCCGNNAAGQIGDNYGDNTVVAYFTMNIYRQCVKLTKVLDGADKIFAGASSSYAVKKDGSLWAWGSNNAGQLGDGSFRTAFRPVQIREQGFSVISPGGTHVLAIKKDGTLWSWGDNMSGELCNGFSTYYSSYHPLMVADHVAEIASSGLTTLILKDDGTLLGCGSNGYSQLGDGTLLCTSAPKEMMKDVSHIATSQNNVYCIKKDGTLWAWGNNNYGGVGNGHQEDIDFFNSYDFYRKIDNDRTVPAGYKQFLVTPFKNYQPVQLLTGIAQVAAFYGSALAVATDGTMYGWGQNAVGYYFGVHGDAHECLSTPTKITGDVKSVLSNGMLIKTSGELWEWGDNPLTDGVYEKDAYKDAITGVVSAAEGFQWRTAVKSDGTLWGWGVFGIIDKKKITEPIQLDEHVKTATAGVVDIYVIKDDGTLYDIDSLTLEDYLKAYAPGNKVTEQKYVRKVGDNVRSVLNVDSGGGVYSTLTFILKTDGTLWADGNNKYGQLGDGKVFFTPKLVP